LALQNWWIHAQAICLLMYGIARLCFPKFTSDLDSTPKWRQLTLSSPNSFINI
jgi:hypothetical protein